MGSRTTPPPMAHSPAYDQNHRISSGSTCNDHATKHPSLQLSPALGRYAPPTIPVHAHAIHDRTSDDTWSHVRSPSSHSVNPSKDLHHQPSPSSSILPQFEHSSLNRHSDVSCTQVRAIDGYHTGQRSPQEGWESQGYNTTAYAHRRERPYPEEPPDHAVRVLVSLICMHTR